MTPSQFGNRIRVRHDGVTVWASFYGISPLGLHCETIDCKRITCKWEALSEGVKRVDGAWWWPESDPTVRQEMKAVNP